MSGTIIIIALHKATQTEVRFSFSAWANLRKIGDTEYAFISQEFAKTKQPQTSQKQPQINPKPACSACTKNR